MEWIGLRYFNVFGRRQDPNGAYAAVIPRWIGEFLGNKAPTINGDGQTSRDFCYIDNVIQANLLSAITENPEAVNQVYNIASGGRTTLNELFYMIKELLGEYHSYIQNISPTYGSFRPGDVRHSQADIQKAKNLLSYQPIHDVKGGMTETIRWFCSRHITVN
jgi:UDP-N-acetylglucosamine 4-epimerase